MMLTFAIFAVSIIVMTFFVCQGSTTFKADQLHGLGPSVFLFD